MTKAAANLAEAQHNRSAWAIWRAATLHPYRVKKLPPLSDLLIKAGRAAKKAMSPEELKALFRAHALSHPANRKKRGDLSVSPSEE